MAPARADPPPALRRAVERAVSAGSDTRWRFAGATGWGEAWSLAAARNRFFVKVATGRHADMLACEADGLAALSATQAIRVPAVSGCGRDSDLAWLALEWLDMGGAANSSALARALAALHRAVTPRGPRGERFGWHRDNWIGGTPQHNAWNDDWCAFFGERRLAPQFALAASNGHALLEEHGARLLAALPSLLSGYESRPALVHGDLWSGNAATLTGGEPVVFDPAVYVGDREVDLAMTALFGGFDEAFYRAYDAAFPLPDGHALRRDLYNLYHLVNHVNLFGADYLARTERTLARLLAVVADRTGREP
jgi:fructosamine-3-kinase